MLIIFEFLIFIIQQGSHLKRMEEDADLNVINGSSIDQRKKKDAREWKMILQWNRRQEHTDEEKQKIERKQLN